MKSKLLNQKFLGPAERQIRKQFDAIYCTLAQALTCGARCAKAEELDQLLIVVQRADVEMLNFHCKL
jgi:hypothetical protein